VRAFRISLGATEVGTLVEAGAGTVFSYDDGFRADPDRPTLSQSLIDPAGRPLDRDVDDGVVPFFENLLPEEGPLRRYLASRGGADTRDDLALLDLLGDNLPGAVRATLAYETDEARTIRERTSRPRPVWRFSLAGIQMKFSASKHGDRWSVATLDEPGDWIVKLPASERPAIVENEFAIMSLARSCGLDVPEIRTIDIDDIDDLDEHLRTGPRAYAIRRFDRTAEGRIHQEDFCQILGLRPESKYVDDTPRATAEDVASIIRELCGVDAVGEWIRRLAFCVIVGNGDAHLKNHAVIYPDGRTPQLAPLYDALCTLRYRHDDTLALSIGGTSAFNDVERATFEDFAHGANVAVRIVKREVGEIVGRLRQTWPTVRETLEDHDVRAILDHRIGTVTPRLLR
jgi:serine/threonine-protein kinase HipA